MTLALLLLPKTPIWKYLTPVQETQCNGHTQHPVLPLLKMFPMTKAEKAPDSPPNTQRVSGAVQSKGGRKTDAPVRQRNIPVQLLSGQLEDGQNLWEKRARDTDDKSKYIT